MTVRILLTGATGCVGTAIREAAAARSDVELWASARRIPVEPSYPSNWIQGDIAELPGRLPEHLHACIHAAAVVHGRNGTEDIYREVNCVQALRLAEALSSQSQFRRFVFISSVAAAVDEPNTTPYGRWKRVAEEELAKMARARGFEVVSLRLATVYGKHDRGNIGQLYEAIRRRRYLRVAPGHTPKSILAAWNAAAALLWAASTEQKLPAVSTLTDPPPVPLDSIETALAEVAGVAPPPRLPQILGWAAALLGSMGRRLGFSAPLDLPRFRTLRRPAAHLPSPWYEELRGYQDHDLKTAFSKAYASGTEASEESSERGK